MQDMSRIHLGNCSLFRSSRHKEKSSDLNTGRREEEGAGEALTLSLLEDAQAALDIFRSSVWDPKAAAAREALKVGALKGSV